MFGRRKGIRLPGVDTVRAFLNHAAQTFPDLLWYLFLLQRLFRRDVAKSPFGSDERIKLYQTDGGREGHFSFGSGKVSPLGTSIG
jgi:hypothetical protein